MLKVQSCKKSKTEASLSELQYLKNSLEILQIESQVKDEQNKRAQKQCLE